MSEPESAFPLTLEIRPLARPPRATVRVPGSKSITNRALVLAALCSRVRKPRLFGCLRSEDTEVMLDSLRRLGYEVETEWVPERLVTVFRGDRPPVPAPEAELWVANSGTTMRFLTALVCLGHGRYRLDGVPRMRERPIEDLLVALRQLGANARSERGNGCPPVVVEADGLKGGRARVRGDVSSQFLSALLLAAPFAEGDVTLEVEGPLVSQPYVDMTVHMMRGWMLQVEQEGGRFHVPGNQRPDRIRYSSYDIEPDASAASYFWAAAAITGGAVTVAGQFARRSDGRERDYAEYLRRPCLQGDVRFVEVLKQMGCEVRHGQEGITVEGPPLLRGIDVDMNDISDTVMTLAAVACFADGPTTIRNVAHVRHKETDRLAALATELRRLGAEVEERADGLTITPGRLRGAEVETYDDHRMAMSLALVGLRVPGVVIKNPACVTKTYPGFFADLERLRC
jgi:3-phosphoshikimate 1-carboxyvinyltransferase